jgi:hypothetical protein
VESPTLVVGVLQEKGSIFAGISYEKIMLVVAKYVTSERLESIRRGRISNTLKDVPKAPDHNKKVSHSVRRAWEEGKYDNEEYRRAAAEGYLRRRSYAGKNNPMYGRPSPRGSGRGKGGKRRDIGHYVRSTWEANFCRILNRLGRRYEYEGQRFDVVVGGIPMTYSPDVFLLDRGVYYEIKGHAKSSSDWECSCDACGKCRAKIKEVRRLYGISVRLIGRKEYKQLTKRFKLSVPGWEGRRKR